jgi:hypothetical protein
MPDETPAYVKESDVLAMARAEFPDDAKELRIKSQQGRFFLVRPKAGSVGWTTLGMGRSAMEALVAARVTKETLERQGKKMS